MYIQNIERRRIIVNKEIVIITGGANRTGIRTCKTIYRKELLCMQHR